MPTETIQQAINLIKSGQKVQARQLLMKTLQADPRQEDAWLWLAAALDSDEQRIRILEKCLTIFPESQNARKGLERLRASQISARPSTPPVEPPPPPAAETPPHPPVLAQKQDAPRPMFSHPKSASTTPKMPRSKLELLLIGLIVVLALAIGGTWLVLTLTQSNAQARLAQATAYALQTQSAAAVSLASSTPRLALQTPQPSSTLTPTRSASATRTASSTATIGPSASPTVVSSSAPQGANSVKIAYVVQDPDHGLAPKIYVVQPPAEPELAYEVKDDTTVSDIFLSPDGERLFYHLMDNATGISKIYGIIASDAPPRLLVASPPPDKNGFRYNLIEISWQPGTNNLVMELQREDFMGPIAGYLVVNTESGKTTNIPVVEDQYGRYLSVFSPDRRFVAAVGPASISLVNLETGQVFDSILSYEATGLPNSDAFFIPGAAWQDDSSYLLTIKLSDQSTHQRQEYDVYRISTDGKVEQLATIPGFYEGENRPYPQFTPDGRWMFYYGADGLHQLDLTSQEDRFIGKLDPGEYRWQYASMSPDGQKILFTGQDGLYWLNIADGQKKKVAPWGSIGDWSPDSSRCVIQIEGQEETVVDAEGQKQKLGDQEIDLISDGSVHWVNERTITYFAASGYAWGLYLQPLGEIPTLIAQGDRFNYYWIKYDTSTPTPRPMADCFDCQIVYISNASGSFQIYKMGEDGSNPVNITPPGKGQVYDFSWSPDGTRIAFVANRSGSDVDNEIYVMNADGSQVVNLTQNQVYDGSPVWSPDGTRIAFISTSEDIHDKGKYLYVMNADGSNPIRVGVGLVDTPPAWSPDGSKIAYLARMTGDEQIMILIVINTDGSNSKSIPIGYAPDYLPGRPFDWSPDGSQIVFQYFKGSGILLFNVATGDVAGRISDNGKYPVWSPDGKQIAFVSRSSTDKDEVSVMNADGADVTPLTPNSNWDDVFQLTWSPGGSKLVFVARQGTNEQIYRVNADGSNLTPLSTDLGIAFRQVAWASSLAPGTDAAAIKPPAALADSCDKFAFVSTDADMSPGTDYRKYAFGVLFVKSINGSDMFALSDNVSWMAGRPRWDSPRLVWSPDGRFLAFESGVASFDYITVSNIETPEFIEIRDDAYPRLSAPAWSPDSGRIAFSFEDNGAMEIGVTNAAGGKIINLTRNPADDQKPAWSPNGRKIAFLSTRDGVSDLFVMNADGSNVTRLTQNMLVESFPAWSPDGSKIAFSDNNDIYVVNADGSGLNNLTFNSAQNNSPAWSPDGLKIAFGSGSQGNAEIYVMNADGSNLLNLTNHPANDYLPVWSPDGSKILFQTDRSNGNGDERPVKSEIYIMNADGSNPINLTNRPDYFNESPAWMPCPPAP